MKDSRTETQGAKTKKSSKAREIYKARDGNGEEARKGRSKGRVREEVIRGEGSRSGNERREK